MPEAYTSQPRRDGSDSLQFDPEVLAKEIALIRRRRELLSSPQPPSSAPGAVFPPNGDVYAASVHASLAEVLEEAAAEASRTPEQQRRIAVTDIFREAHAVRPFGLAISGGGIRSATFGLGVLQGLAERGLLKYVDYLSTVSGGGYIGAWLHGVIRTRCRGDVRKAEKILSPSDNPIPASPERDPIAFLRKYSNYLAPSPGLFSADTWVIGSIWIRNVLLNQLILVPTLMALVLALLIGGYVHQVRLSPAILRGWLLVLPGAGTFLCLLAAVAISVVNLRLINNRTFHGKHDSGERSFERWAERNSSLVAPLAFMAALLLACAGFEASPVVSAVVGVELLFLFGFFQYFGGFTDCYVALRQNFTEQGRGVIAGVHVAWMSIASWAVSLVLMYAIWSWTRATATTPAGAWQQLAFGPPAFCASLLVGVGLQVGLMGVDYPDAAREWLARIAANLALLCTGWIALFVLAVFGPYAFAWVLDRYALLGVTAIGGWGVTTAAGVLLGRRPRETATGTAGRSVLRLIEGAAPTVFMLGYLLLIACTVQIGLERISPIEKSTATWAAVLTPTLYNVDVSTSGEATSTEVRLRTSQPPGWLPRLLDPVVRFEQDYWQVLAWSPVTFVWMLSSFLVCVTIAGVASWRFNINEFSLHHFYKNRLVRCYLGASSCGHRHPNRLTGFDPSDDFPISALASEHRSGDSNEEKRTPYFGPYAIVNTALNLNAGSELARQERRADSFVFAPAYSGFQPRGSREDDEHVKRWGLKASGFTATRGFTSPAGPSLGTAMAISGAAASPNSGSHTSAPMAFLLTVFDARLGWWIGNPRRPKACLEPGPRFAWAYLFAELLARTNGRSKYVNVSDGGHFENLGLYELVRRRCRYIIVSDAEQDVDLAFEGLGSAIRKCRADFGVEIDINPKSIGRVDGLNGAHCVIGTIRYPEEETGTPAGLSWNDTAPTRAHARGWLLYLKASVTGDEPADVLEYRTKFPDFPHQSTSDQFFSESQFESYRRLGLHTVRAAFEGVNKPEVDASVDDAHLTDVFQKLTRKWYAPVPVSDESATRLADSYSALMKLLGEKEDGALTAELLPDIFDRNRPGEPLAARQLAIALIALQLMQNVFTEFQLEFAANRANPRNAGWIKVFKRWAASDVLYGQVWTGAKKDYNPIFQDFMEEMRRANSVEEWPDRP